MRWDLVARAKRRIAQGYYEEAVVQEVALGRIEGMLDASTAQEIE